MAETTTQRLTLAPEVDLGALLGRNDENLRLLEAELALRIVARGNEITLRPSREASGFIKRGHALVFSGGGADFLDNETVEAIRANEHGGLLSSLSKGLPGKKRK